jgi:hypothetical protein
MSMAALLHALALTSSLGGPSGVPAPPPGWDPALPAWTHLGPRRYQPVATDSTVVWGGAVFALASTPSNPAVLYAGTCGGLWKTVADESAATWNWTCVTDAIPRQALAHPPSVGAIGLNPAFPSRIHVGLGNRRVPASGFFTSQDGGKGWVAATGAIHTQTTAIVALGPSTVLAAGDRGLLRSVDGGASFAPVSIGGLSTRGVSHLASVGTSTLVCATVEQWDGGGGTKLWFSLNGGASWNPASVSNPAAVATLRHLTFAAAPSSTSTVYALCDSTAGKMLNGVLASTDSGTTWTFRPAPQGTFFEDPAADGTASLTNRMLTVYPLSGAVLFAASRGGGVHRSLDGGSSWHRLVEPKHGGYVDHHAAAWLPAPGASLAPRLVYGNDAGIFILKGPTVRTTPSGPDPAFLDQRRNDGFASHEAWALGSSPGATAKALLPLQDTYSAYRSGSTATFHRQSMPQPGTGDGAGSLLHPVNPTLALAVNAGGRPHRATDGGQGFQLSATGVAAADVVGLSLPLAPALVADGADGTGNTAFLRTVKGLYRTQDFGVTWQPTAFYLPNPAMNARVFAAEGSAWASGAYHNSLYVTADAGASTLTLSPPAAVSAGTTWSRPFGAVAFKASTGGAFPTLMVGLAPGILEPLANTLFRTPDQGLTWLAPVTPVSRPVHALRGARGLPKRWLAGTSTGVLLSDDDGAHWVELGQGLPVVMVTDLWVSPDGTRVRISTFGRGMWEITLPGDPAF